MKSEREKDRAFSRKARRASKGESKKIYYGSSSGWGDSEATTLAIWGKHFGGKTLKLYPKDGSVRLAKHAKKR